MSLFFFIGNKSNINHEEKKKRKKIHGVHDGEQKQENNIKENTCPYIIEGRRVSLHISVLT